MTNKEAATIVERIRYYMEGGECWTPTEFEAMDRAIEILNRQDIPDINVNDMIYRQMAIDALGAEPLAISEYEEGLHTMWTYAKEAIEQLPPAQPDSCEFYDTESHFCALHRPSVQPDRSLWFHIGETCVDESKGIISAEEAIKKIRELLRAADLILVEIASPDTFTEPKFHHEDWSEIL